jgi:Methyltransferase domain
MNDHQQTIAANRSAGKAWTASAPGMNPDARRKTYPDAPALLAAIDALVRETPVVLDVGCGIVPINYFRPKLHIMVEPWDEYARILSYRHADDNSVVVLKSGAIEAFALFADRSVDSIFLLDVIEHLEKEDGVKVISEIERVARDQAVIFTPLGFMAQHVEAGQKDAWGLNGAEVQEHRSGWTPEDFGPKWSFHICEDYHRKDFKGELLEKPHGAFFAVFDAAKNNDAQPAVMSDIRRPLPSEVELAQVKAELADARNTAMALDARAASLAAELDNLNAMTYVRARKFLHRLFLRRKPH